MLRYSMPRKLFSIVLLFAALLALLSVAHPQNRARRQRAVAGSRAIILEDRLAALRRLPDVRAPLIQRLRRGEIVGVLRIRPGWMQVFVSRRTRGWILSEAVMRSGHAPDAEKLLKLMAETKDEFARARLARLCADEFRNTPAAPKALTLLAQAAEAACEELTRDARKRIEDEGKSASATHTSRREWMLSFSGLDRWNREGIMFEYAAAKDALVYDGAAYKELLKKYPRSLEAGRIPR